LSAGDSLGGDLKYLVTASLTTPVPVLRALNLHAHAFADVANLLRWSAPLSAMASQVTQDIGHNT
jgi:outer membrane protein assembly factor BamA